MGEQPSFDVKQQATVFPAKATESAVAGHDTMAGNHQRIWVGATCAADGARRSVDRQRQRSVGAGFTVRNFANLRPDAALKRCAVRRQRQTKDEGGIPQIAAQLPRGLLRKQCRCSNLGTWCEKLDGANLIGGAPQSKCKARGCNHCLKWFCLSDVM